jgi:hypothetical protein
VIVDLAAARAVAVAGQSGKPLRLHLGCGQTKLAGYVNIDYPSSEHGR